MAKEAVSLGHNDPVQGSAHLTEGELATSFYLLFFKWGLILGSSDFPC